MVATGAMLIGISHSLDACQAGCLTTPSLPTYNPRMATETEQPQEPTPQTLQPTSDVTPLVSAPLHERIAAFYGNHHDFLLWLIANPSRPHAEGMRKLGLSELTLYSWRRDIATFKEVMDAVTQHRGNLRTQYAQAAFNEAIPAIVDTMIERAKGTGKDSRDAQRAGERILEATGVLRKDGDMEPGVESISMIALRIRRSKARQ